MWAEGTLYGTCGPVGVRNMHSFIFIASVHVVVLPTTLFTLPTAVLGIRRCTRVPIAPGIDGYHIPVLPPSFSHGV